MCRDMYPENPRGTGIGPPPLWAHPFPIYLRYLLTEVGKVTLKSNGDEALSDEFLLKSNGNEALNDVFLQKLMAMKRLTLRRNCSDEALKR